MLVQRLFTILIIISSLVQTVSSRTYRYTYLKCRKDSETWLCSESDQCGYTYNSCIGDSKKSDAGTSFSGILIVFIWIAICIGSFFYRNYRRQQARERFTRQVQTIIDQSQQQMIVHVISNPLVATTSLIQEELPPTYQQVIETRQSREN